MTNNLPVAIPPREMVLPAAPGLPALPTEAAEPEETLPAPVLPEALPTPAVEPAVPWRPGVEFTLGRHDLVKTLKVLAATAKGPSSLPAIRRTVRFEDSHLVATDLDVWCRVYSPAVRALPCAVDVATLLLVVSKLRSQEVVLRASGPSELEVSGMRLQALDAAEWPRMPSAPAKGVLTVTGEVPRAIEKILMACSDDETRKSLQGVHFELCDDYAVATNGHRLHMLKLPQASAHAHGIVPKKALELLVRAMKAERAECARLIFFRMPGMNEKGDLVFLTFVCGPYEFRARPAVEVFPDYRKILPSGKPAHRIVFDRAVMLGAVAELGALCSGDLKGMELRMDHEGTVVATVRNPARGSCVREIPATGWAVGRRVGVSTVYLGDILESCTSERVELQLAVDDPMTTLAIADGDFTGVVMAMRL